MPPFKVSQFWRAFLPWLCFGTKFPCHWVFPSKPVDDIPCTADSRGAQIQIYAPLRCHKVRIEIVWRCRVHVIWSEYCDSVILVFVHIKAHVLQNRMFICKVLLQGSAIVNLDPIYRFRGKQNRMRGFPGKKRDPLYCKNAICYPETCRQVLDSRAICLPRIVFIALRIGLVNLWLRSFRTSSDVCGPLYYRLAVVCE